MGCRCLSVCPCETTVRVPGTAPWEPVLTAWHGRGHGAGLTGARPALEPLGRGLVAGSSGLQGTLLGPSARSASLAQLLLSEKGSVATHRPTAAQGLGLQVGTLWGCPRPTCMGVSRDARGRSGGRSWGRFGPHHLPSPGMAKAPELLLGSSPSPGPACAAARLKPWGCFLGCSASPGPVQG